MAYRYADDVPQDVRDAIDALDDPRLIDTDRDFGPIGMGRYHAVRVEAGVYITLDRHFCGTLTLEAGPLDIEDDEARRRGEDLLDDLCFPDEDQEGDDG